MEKILSNSDVASVCPLAATGVEKMILIIREKQMLLVCDLTTLYGVETRRINEPVKCNIERFPEDFCFQLHSCKIPDRLKSQFAILNGKGNMHGLHIKNMPYVFAEQGVAMLSSVWKSESAIRVNIAIMRAFVQLRHYMMSNSGVENRLVTYKYFLILNGFKLEADVKTLNLLRNEPKSVSIWIFCDQYGKTRLTEDMIADFRFARRDVLIDVNPAKHKFHDRYIFVDFKEKGESF